MSTMSNGPAGKRVFPGGAPTGGAGLAISPARHLSPMAVFPQPYPDAAFRARWRAKVTRARGIWTRAWADERPDAVLRMMLARRLLDQLYRQRDALVAGHRDPCAGAPVCW